MSKPEHKIVIRYKSGIEVHVRADDLDVRWDQVTGTVTRLTWTNMQPNPVMAGLHNIESIWMGE